MNLFDFGLNKEEPNLWDIFPDVELRVYDRAGSYFACWDIGSVVGHTDPETGLCFWPKPPNPAYHWDFRPRFYDVEGISMVIE